MQENKIVNSYNFDDILHKYGEGSLYKNFINQIEKPLIEWSLRISWGNQVKAAKMLGLNRNTIHSKIKKLGIQPEIYK